VSVIGDHLLAIHDALAEANLPHAFGGAIALGYCTLEPRATRDIDLNVFVGPTRVGEVLAALPKGVMITASSVEQGERDGQLRLWWDNTPIDIFLSVLSFHDEVARSARHVPFMGRTIPVIDGTALAVFKALRDRTQHWADIEAMVDAGAIDIQQTAARIRELDGDDSPRASRLLRLSA
jgi:hypothetical protein